MGYLWVILDDINHFQNVALSESIMAGKLFLIEAQEGVGPVPHVSRYTFGERQVLGYNNVTQV